MVTTYVLRGPAAVSAACRWRGGPGTGSAGAHRRRHLAGIPGSCSVGRADFGPPNDRTRYKRPNAGARAGQRTDLAEVGATPGSAVLRQVGTSAAGRSMHVPTDRRQHDLEVMCRPPAGMPAPRRHRDVSLTHPPRADSTTPRPRPRAGPGDAHGPGAGLTTPAPS